MNVSHDVLAGSLRLDSKAALMPQIGLCAEGSAQQGVSSLPLHAQIIACSLHSGCEGGTFSPFGTKSTEVESHFVYIAHL